MLYKDPEFISIIKEEDFKRGLFKNIIYEDGLKVMQVNKYALSHTVDMYEKANMGEIINYTSEDYGIIYFIDNKGQLWEYDILTDKLELMYEIDEFKYIIDFRLDNNKIYGLFKDHNYYTKSFCLGTGQILREIRTNIDEIEDYTMDYEGNSILLKANLNLIKLSIKNNQIEEFSLKGILEPLDNNRKYIMAMGKDETIAIGCKLNGVVKVISLKELSNKNFSEALLKEFKVNKIMCMATDRNGYFHINHEKNGQFCIEKIKDYEKLEQVFYLKLKSKDMVFDKRDRLYLRSIDDVFYIIKKKLSIRSINNYRRNSGIYYSPILDSQKENMKWHKILIDAHIPMDTQIRIRYYAFDHRNIPWADKSYDMEYFIHNESISMEEKENYFEKLWQGEIVNPKEALFHRARGRYILMRIELNGRALHTPLMKKIRAYFGTSSYTKYLPEIYESTSDEDDFLERYLSILESFYMDIEEKIDYVSNYFHVDTTPPKFLRWLCKWIGMDIYQTWEDNKLRKLIKRAPYLYRKRGTKKAIEDILEIYLGHKPIIVENFLINKGEENIELKKVMGNLYENNPYSYTVLINSEEDLNQEEVEWIDKILKNESPAFSKYNFIILKPWIFLDKHSYVGLNSSISGYTYLKLDGKSMLPYNAVLMDKDRENQLDGYTRLNINGNLD
ncbi:MAG: phage tail protein [Anaeromicrobium sp.]|jgi:phage tail-like protein|uniref:phage tail protein n=1 Tax=Anaeromicrobium sp. TaxID=1929132 RepID=UPI0025F829DC|nr:phage tail protein [Anaeromicrobium sp.]MCT4593119.1 phage tail protein [Anaeromicrobium sp.]